jgi:Ni/Co efflux regulator RcnB
MKKALSMAAALTLATAAAAAAHQDRHDDDHAPAPHAKAAPHAPAPGGHPGPAAPEARSAPAQPVYRAQAQTPGARGAPAAQFDGFHGQGVGPHAPAQVYYRGRSFTSFRAAPFSYPGGWGYRRWGVGQVLPGLFLSQGYFIGNWAGYGLAPPPPGLAWVRYGPDALLVNTYTGQIVETVYGVFWW